MIINKTLKNGIRVAAVPIPGLRAVTVEVLVKIGSKYEKVGEHGLSHFLEHMAFKGTEKRHTATDIFREMDMKGADYNAETGLENTSYNITTVKNNLEWAVEILSDFIFNSTFPIKEVEKEKGVICEEIKMYKDNPMMGMGSEMMKFMYGKSKIGCWNISGEVEEMEKVTREALISYRNKYLNTSQMVVVLAGNVTEVDLDLVEKYFSSKVKVNDQFEFDFELNNELIRQEMREVEQGHFVLAVPSYGWNSEKRYVMRLLDLILAGNSSSRLFEEIRSKRGWAYYVFCVSETIKETGMWGVQAGVAMKNIEQAVELTKKILLDTEKTIKVDEVDRAKTFINGRIELNLDQSEFWSGYVGEKWLLEERLVTPLEELEKLKQVKLNEILEVCREMFKPDKIRNLTILAK